MIDPKMISDMEQAQEAIVELLPSLWRKMHIKMIKEGFTEEQSIELLKEYIYTTC